MAALNSGRGEIILATSGDMSWQTKDTEVNQWRQVNYTFNSGDAEFIEVNIFVYNGMAVDGKWSYTASGNGWICMPMLEEGSEYTGWTPAETDYDYVGGNLLEDTMTLTRSSDKSNLQFASGLIMFENTKAATVYCTTKTTRRSLNSQKPCNINFQQHIPLLGRRE